MRRTLFPVLLTFLSLIAFAPAAQANPPLSGQRLTLPGAQPVQFGFRGLVLIGPSTRCSDTGLCPSTLPVAHVIWKRDREGSPFRRAGELTNRSAFIFFTAPFGNGWQWIWNPRIGAAVIPASALIR